MIYMLICKSICWYKVITLLSYKLSYPGSSSESESEDSVEPKRKSKYSGKVKESASDTKASKKDLKSRSSTLRDRKRKTVVEDGTYYIVSV